MADRSVWWRTGTGVAAWVVLALAASGAAWAAVDVVGDEADAPAPVPVRSPDADASSSEPTTEPTTDDPTESTEPSETTEPTETGGEEPSETEPTEPETTEPETTVASGKPQTLSSTGGTVVVKCIGTGDVKMLYATPSTGWQSRVESRGTDEVEVEFLRGDSEVRLRAECDGGTVEADVDDD